MAPRVGVIIPTFRRDSALCGTLQLLATQVRPPDEVLIVDNAATDSCRSLCEELRTGLSFALHYMATTENGGPAGATAIGMSYFLERFGDQDWIVRADDDTPRVGPGHLDRLLTAAQEAAGSIEHVGAVGTSGARFDPRRARLYKPSVQPGFVAVDYLATNYYPFYAVRAVRRVGVFRSDLFFGHDEVEYGLRLRRAGYSVLRLDVRADVREISKPDFRLGEPSWRRFYSVRNQIVLAREFGTRTAPYRVITIAILKPILGMAVAPRLASRHLRLNLRAIRDALRGHLGRTVEPRVVEGSLDARH